ncbi:putative sigma-54 modulation protein [Balneicella halophila]|uniref:Putative sigma-54 modulation protein n=1 Tax=Balneicella halophila TaxID=1537566 RepID=A0A7L4UPG0_BALHA|nr:ribosome-associated translation inhibitor RaiA [Balneicella halophila]PVX50924.1 putative sigma-54 modulation protein [Balneicella halophila]
MNVNIESLDFKADKKLLDFIEKKVDKLTKFYDGIVSADVKLRLEKEESKENKIAEIKLNVPQSDLFAKRNSTTFEEAVDDVVEALRRQLKKHKEKLMRR